MFMSQLQELAKGYEKEVSAEVRKQIEMNERIDDMRGVINTKIDKETGEALPTSLNKSLGIQYVSKYYNMLNHGSLGGCFVADGDVWREVVTPEGWLVTQLEQDVCEALGTTYIPVDRIYYDVKNIAKDYVNLYATQNGEGSPLLNGGHGDVIAFSNGTYDFKTKELRDTTLDDYQLFKLPYPLIKPDDGETLLADEWLEWLVGKESALGLKQFIGFCLHKDYDHIAAYAMLINDSNATNGQNGKSYVMDFIQLILGAPKFKTVSPHVSGIGLQQFGGSEARFIKVGLRGNLANMKDDENDTFIERTGDLKSMTDGGDIFTDVKGKGAIKFRAQAKFIFGMNHLPSFRDDSKGMRSRMFIVPFIRSLDEPEEMALFAEKGAKFHIDQQKELMFSPEYLGKFVYECIEEYNKAYATNERNPFNMSDRAKEMIGDLMATNDPLSSFMTLKGYEITGDENDMVLHDVFMEDYNDFAQRNAMSVNNLYNLLESEGARVRIRNGYTAKGTQKFRSITKRFKDTDQFTSKVMLGIKKVEE